VLRQVRFDSGQRTKARMQVFHNRSERGQIGPRAGDSRVGADRSQLLQGMLD
jgi:hypothetical protein